MFAKKNTKFLRLLILCLPYLICFAFFIAYSVLSIVRHQHYQSFGYDLGINDQVVWRYSQFQLPIATISPFWDQVKFAEHVEFVYAFIAPFYWLWSSPIMLILLQNASICISALAVYLLSRKHKLTEFNSNIIMIAYLMFYGVQFALWTDVHSSAFAASFIMWFIYFLDSGNHKLSFLFFFLTITAKESTGTAVFFVSLVYFWYRREKIILIYLFESAAYVLFIYFIFYPYIMHVSYLYANSSGLLSNLNPFSLIDSPEKRITIFYSFASWGFIPLFSPIMLLPALSHFFKFFVIASDLSGAHTLYGHYRVTVAPLLALSTIWTFNRFGYRLQKLVGLWLLATVLLSQYFLHLPLSYLAKQWFWQDSSSVKTINTMIESYLPKNASVVAQNNIAPHISQRDRIYMLYPISKQFAKNSPCRQKICDWLRWDNNPEFLIVDISTEWDARHLLVERNSYLKGLQNIEKAGVVKKYKQIGSTILYKVRHDPDL